MRARLASFLLLLVSLVAGATGLQPSPSAPVNTFKAALLSATEGQGVDLVKSAAKRVASVAAVRALTAATTADVLDLVGWTAGTRIGGGRLVYDSTDTTTADDGCTVFVDAAGHRWKRQFGGGVVLLSWCGVDFTGAAAADSKMAAAIAAAGVNGTILLDQPGTVKLTTQISKTASTDCFSVIGLNPKASTIDYTSLATGTDLFYLQGGSGVLVNAKFQGILFYGPGGANTARAFEIDGQDGVRLIDVRFSAATTATVAPVLLHNKTAGTFTEFVTVENFEFTSASPLALEYKVTSGNNSFHGSGLLGGLAHSAASNLIVIGSGAKPYDAPLTVQDFASTNGVVIVNNASASPVSFYGSLNIETSGGTVTTFAKLASTNAVYFAGPILSLSSIDYGTLSATDQIEFSGSEFSNLTQLWFKPKRSYYSTVSSPATIGRVSSLGPNLSSALIDVRFSATNYEYRYLGRAEHNGTGAAGIWTQLAAGFNNNTAGYGAPTITVDSSGNVIATNASWPASTVSVQISVVPLDGLYTSYQ